MQPLQEKLRQRVTRESLVTFCFDECLARVIVVMRVTSDIVAEM